MDTKRKKAKNEKSRLSITNQGLQRLTVCLAAADALGVTLFEGMKRIRQLHQAGDSYIEVVCLLMTMCNQS